MKIVFDSEGIDLAAEVDGGKEIQRNYEKQKNLSVNQTGLWTCCFESSSGFLHRRSPGRQGRPIDTARED